MQTDARGIAVLIALSASVILSLTFLLFAYVKQSELDMEKKKREEVMEIARMYKTNVRLREQDIQRRNKIIVDLKQELENCRKQSLWNDENSFKNPSWQQRPLE